MDKKLLKTLLIGFILLAGLTIQLATRQRTTPLPRVEPSAPVEAYAPPPVTQLSASDQMLANAFASHLGNLQVEGQGTVNRMLADDTSGSRHQRFVLELASGQTLLVAHNIDLAPRLAGLKTGDAVRFFGEYEWKSEGGVIHWTHRDPEGRHVAGWLQHGGRTYQ